MKRLVFSFALLSLVIPFRLFAMENEPDGFRDIKWGTDISKLSDMILVENTPNKKFYKKETDRMSIGTANIIAIYYLFCGNKFSSVQIEFQGDNNFDKLEKVLLKTHGSPAKSEPQRYGWLGNHVLITLEYNQYIQKGSIVYLYLPALDRF